jgi:hypothetical protein
MLSSLFGQSRSDYVNFLYVKVPIVFLTDSSGPCYHSAQDDVSVVDFLKLNAQIRNATALVSDLVAGEAPTFAEDPPATYADAVALKSVGDAAQADLGRFSAADQARLQAVQADLARIVADGPEAFGLNDIVTVLTGAATSIGIFSSGDCDGFTRQPDR